MKIQKKLDAIVNFLRAHVRGGLIFLMAMLPMGGVPLARTFRSDEEDELREFIAPLLGKRNIYFGANPLKRPIRKKPSKEDMASMSHLWVDIDLRPGVDRETELERILERISAFSPRPTTLILSGNGVQAIWHLDEPMSNDGDYDGLESCNKQLEARLGGDACHNIDRILRVPGTLNLPTKKKKALAYTEVMSELVWQEDRSVRVEEFELLPERAVELLRKDGKLKDRWLGDDTGLMDTSRSGFDLSLVALLKHRGLSREDTEKVLRLFPHGKYSDIRDERDFDRCWEKADEGGRADLDCHQAIDELNKEFAVVLTGGKTSIIHESDAEDGGKDFDLLGPDAFRLWLQNRYCTVVGSKGKLTSLGLSKVWLDNPRRRQYHKIGLWPGRDVPGAYNMWHGFAVEEKEGDCRLFRWHLYQNVCQCNRQRYKYLLAWLADIVQNPGRKAGTAIVLVGKQGTGKSIVGDIMARLLGRHHRQVASLRFVTGRFNAHLKDCLFLQCDEAFFAGDPTAASTLKSLVTSPKLSIEFKGKEAIWIENLLRLLITSNALWVVPAGLEERRFATFEVGTDHMQDRAYFGAIMEQIDDGGAEALLHFLKNHKYSRVDLSQLPQTTALRDQKELSLPAGIRWILSLLRGGALPGDKQGEGRSPRPLLYDHFVDATNKVGTRYKEWEMEIAKLLKEWIPGLAWKQGSYTPPREDEEKRTRIWLFPPLGECRKAFEKKTGDVWDWDDQEDWLAEDPDF